jgi:PTS system mannose-specific IIA component
MFALAFGVSPNEYVRPRPSGQPHGPTPGSCREIMIGLVLVTHGRLAAEFRAALEHVVGPQRQIETVAIAPDDNIESRRQEIIDAVHKVDSGDGVAILTDMFGGTPSNLAISVMNAPNVEVVAGINLPMLVKLASVRNEKPLSEAVESAQEAGRKYINIASHVLAGK